MLNSRQRAQLRGLANSMETIFQVGKGGINDQLIKQVDEALEKRELIKVTVLENSMLNPKETGFEIAEKLGAEYVCATGRKLVFYRRSKNPKVEHIIF